MHVGLHITPNNYQQIMSVKQRVFVLHLCALPRPSVCAQDDHTVRLHVLQQTELQTPHGQLLPLLQQTVVAGGKRQPVVGVHLQIGQIIVRSLAVLLQVSRQQRRYGEIVQN